MLFQENLIVTTRKEKSEYKDLDIEVQRLERQIGQQRRTANQSASSSAAGKGSSSSSTSLRYRPIITFCMHSG